MGTRPWLILACAALGCGNSDVHATADAHPQPDAVPVTCDTVAQDCASHLNASLDKCSLVQVAGQLASRCVTSEGFGTAGSSCRRSTGPGHDDCTLGFYCTGRTLPVDETGFPLAFVCRTFCRTDDACGAGERCTAIGAGVPQDGICLPVGCRFFDTSCGADSSCDPTLLVDRQTYVGICRAVVARPLALGADCSGEGTCGPGAFCGPNAARTALICIAECDDAHPCASGTCRPFSGLPAGAGSCQ